MSAILCGKRSFFEESTAAAVPKRIRCSSSSPIRFSPSPPRQTSASSFDQSPLSPSRTLFLVEQLVAIFPDMEKELLERTLQECGDDLDSAIRRLHELRLGSSHNDLAASVDTSNAGPEAKVQLQSQGDKQTEENVPASGAEWVELFVGEMMSASNVDDAKARASKALQVLEKSIVARATAEASQNFLEENSRLKQQVEALIQENGWLKRLVSIQHERQKEHEDRGKELDHLKQVVSQYQEQLRTLEVNNYALTMHLKQAQQSSSIPGRFNPDVF